MKSFFKIMSISMQSRLYYRKSFFINLLTPIVLLVGQFLLWDSLYKLQGGGSIGSLSRAEMFSYILVVFAMQNLLTWSSENTLANEIRSGAVISRFIRPVSLLSQSIADMTGSMLLQGGVNLCVLLVGFGVFFSHLTLPGFASFLLFLPCFILACLLRMMLINIFSLLSFFTTGHLGLTWTRQALYDFFAGAILPVVMFPTWLKTITYLTPFPYMLQTPVAVLLKMETPGPYFAMLGLQLLWLFAFWLFYYLIYKKVRKNLTIAGG